MNAVRRLRVLFLTLIVLAGQAHSCIGNWVLPDGTECLTCPKGPCGDALSLENLGNHVSLSETGDCHLCCNLAPCEQDNQESATQKALGFNLHLALAESRLAVRSFGIVAPRSVHVQIESSFPNAPPVGRQSRAPPVQLS